MTNETNRKLVPRRPRRLGRTLALAAFSLVLLGVFAAPARAHVHVFVGGAFGVPIYPYPYIRPYPYVSAYPYPAYPVYNGYALIGPPAGIPPPGWVRGHWAWRHAGWGRRFRAWVPAHLR
ncbi:MAG: hypothetical protein ACHQ9S_11645 [Candidatus Binatia bacterium]